jgi:hypothetical protein
MTGAVLSSVLGLTGVAEMILEYVLGFGHGGGPRTPAAGRGDRLLSFLALAAGLAIAVLPWAR